MADITRAFSSRLECIDLDFLCSSAPLENDPEVIYKLTPKEFAIQLPILIICSLKENNFGAQALHSIINFLDTQGDPLHMEFWSELSTAELKALQYFLFFLAIERPGWHFDSRLSRAADRLEDLMDRREREEH